MQDGESATDEDSVAFTGVPSELQPDGVIGSTLRDALVAHVRTSGAAGDGERLGSAVRAFASAARAQSLGAERCLVALKAVFLDATASLAGTDDPLRQRLFAQMLLWCVQEYFRE